MNHEQASAIPEPSLRTKEAPFARFLEGIISPELLDKIFQGELFVKSVHSLASAWQVEYGLMSQALKQVRAARRHDFYSETVVGSAVLDVLAARGLKSGDAGFSDERRQLLLGISNMLKLLEETRQRDSLRVLEEDDSPF